MCINTGKARILKASTASSYWKAKTILGHPYIGMTILSDPMDTRSVPIHLHFHEPDILDLNLDLDLFLDPKEFGSGFGS